MFADHPTVICVVEVVVATTPTGAAGIEAVLTAIWPDGVEAPWPVSTATTSK